jgi:type I restriction enzyme S subunit
MSRAWNRGRLGDVCRVVPGFAFKSSDWQTHGIPVVKIKNITGNNSVDLATTDFVPESLLTSKLQKFVIKDGDILVAMTGATAGKVGKVRTARSLLLNQRVAKIVPVEADREFIWAVVSSQEYQDKFFHLADGAAQPNMSGGQIEGVEIPLPPLSIQRRVAGILSAYYELIENSQRRINILESMARAIYHETIQSQESAAMPKALMDCKYWRFISENVGAYRATKRYFATADVDGLAFTGSGIEYSYSDKPSRAQKQPLPHSVWFARMKDTYKIAWYGAGNANEVAGSILSSGFAGFEAIDPDLWPLLFLTISSKEFHLQKDIYCTGATQMSLTNDGLGRIEMPIPEESFARRLGKDVKPMLDAMLMLQKGIEVLRHTRSLLLPRLLSGQITVEAEAV